MRTRPTSLDFAVGIAFASIPFTLDYESTVSCRAIVFQLPNDLRKEHRSIERRSEPTNDSSKRFTSRPAPTGPAAGLALSLQINLYGPDPRRTLTSETQPCARACSKGRVLSGTRLSLVRG